MNVAPANSPADTVEPATPNWMKRVPMVTGVLAGLAGFLTVKSANISNQANYNGTMAVLHQSKSSDAWGEYQADSMKRHIDQVALMGIVSDPGDRKKITSEIDKYTTGQKKAQTTAATEAELREEEMYNGQQKLQQKNLLDYAGVAAQLGIALASVAALTKRRAAFQVSLLVGFLALIITGYALVEPFLARMVWHK